MQSRLVAGGETAGTCGRGVSQRDATAPTLNPINAPFARVLRGGSIRKRPGILQADPAMTATGPDNSCPRSTVRNAPMDLKAVSEND